MKTKKEIEKALEDVEREIRRYRVMLEKQLEDKSARKNHDWSRPIQSLTHYRSLRLMLKWVLGHYKSKWYEGDTMEITKITLTEREMYILSDLQYMMRKETWDTIKLNKMEKELSKLFTRIDKELES